MPDDGIGKGSLVHGVSFPASGSGIEWPPMKWKPGKRSGDIEDRRGAGGGFGAGGGMPIPMGRLGGGGIGTLIVLAIVYFLFIQGGGGGGGFNVPDPTSSFPQVPQSGTGNDSVPGSPSEEKEVQFVDFVQGDAQDFGRSSSSRPAGPTSARRWWSSATR